MNGLTPALARYLLAVHEGARRRVDVAEALSVARPSVTKAIERLAAMGLVTEAPDHSLHLTEAGTQLARALAASVETIERCLVGQGMAPGCAHRLACAGALASGCPAIEVP